MRLTRRLSVPSLATALLFAASAAANGVDPTRISLPKGPGSVEGLATADFSPSLSTGSASYEVPIAVPPASAGFGPTLSLSYDSGGGVTEIGIGWRLAGVPKIRRRVEDGLPRFDAKDALELVGLGSPSELLPLEDGTLRPRYEDGTFVRVVRGDAGVFEARTKAGVTYRFGGAGFTEEQSGRVAAYLLAEERDRHGHRIAYEWDRSEGHALLTHVTWNDFDSSSRNEVTLSYESRPDAHRRYSTGILETITRRLTSVEVKHGGTTVRTYELGYGDGAHPGLASVDLVGADGTTRLPPARFEYTAPKLAADASQIVSMTNPPGRSTSDRDVTLADLDGDGLPDLLVAKAGHYRSYSNRDGASWGDAADFAEGDSPSVSLSDVGVQIADLDADGAPDLVAKSGTNDFRYFPRPEMKRFGASVPIATVPTFSFEDPDVRLADVDGDRRTDVLITTPSGIAVSYNVAAGDFTEPSLVGPIIAPEMPLFSDGHTEVCDVNGDRVEDLCLLRSGALTYFLGMGRGLFDEATEATSVPEWDPSAPYRLIDLNGDGWVDLVRVDLHRVSYALAVGEGRFGGVASVEGTPEKNETTVVEFADMNASGTTDVLWIDLTADAASYRYLELFPDGRAGLLRKIDSGLGKVQTIDYAPAARFAATARQAGHAWSSRANVAMPVVTRVTVDDSLGDPLLVSEMSYRDGAYDPAERTFAGFGAGTRRQIGDVFTPTLVTEDTFDAGFSERALRGALLREEVRDEAGSVFSRTTNQWTARTLATAPDGRTVDYAFKSSERVEHVEGSVTGTRTTLTEFEQDAYGNATDEKRWGEVLGADTSAGHDEAIVHRVFANDPDEWLLGFVATEELSDAAGKRVSLSRKYYDGDDFTGLPLGQIARGDVTREEAWVGPADEDFELVNATRYDADGLPSETRDARGGGRSFTWAPDHTTLTSERVKLESAVSLVEIADTDPAFGTLRAVTGYDGQTTRYVYDALGRLVKVVKPGDSDALPTIAYAYDVAAPLSRVVTSARRRSGEDAVDVTETLFDGAGRNRGALTHDGERLLLASVTLLDTRGNGRRTLLPRWVTAADGESPPLLVDGARGTDTWRDALGREIRTRSALGIETRTEYAPFEKRHWDGGQNDPGSPYEHVPTIERTDGLGRVVAHVRTLNGSVLESDYGRDAAGNLTFRADPEGHTATYEYDGRSRRTRVHDPDLGTYGFSFDETGNVVARTYPDGVTGRFEFDLAGRSVSEDWDGDGKPDVTRTWDERTGETGETSDLYRGKLVRVVEPSGFVEHEYDTRGRVTATRYGIGDVTYTVGSHYDAQDRETLHVYPDGSSVEIRRNGRGQIEGYGKAVEVVYGEDGLEVRRRFSTGVTVESGYDDDRRRTDFLMKTAAGKTIESLHWDWDSASNLTKIEDLRSGVAPESDRTEAYRYDNLYRLSGAQGTWGHTEWHFSPSGNLLGRDSTVPGQALAHAQYTGAPHAPTAFDDRVVQYDARGRMLSDGVRTYTWNAADQLVRVVSADGATVDSEFGADGERRARTERRADGTESTTHFIDAWSEVRDGVLVRYIVHGGQRIVRLAASNGTKTAAAVRPHGGPTTTSMVTSDGLRVLAVLALLVAAFVVGRPRSSRRTLPSTVVAALGVVCAGCSGDSFSRAPVPREGSVQSLARSDTLFATDLLGSLLAEVDGDGAEKTQASVYPFGSPRIDTSNETRKYAGAQRDSAVGIDRMGARFYAPSLGMWASGEPNAVTEPTRLVTADFAAQDPYAYAKLSPVVSADSDGHFAHVAIGALLGALVGGTTEAAMEYFDRGRVDDWGRIAAAAVGGAVGGALTALLPAPSFSSSVGIGALSSAAHGVTERLVASGGKSAGRLLDVLVDAERGALLGIGKAALPAAEHAIERKPRTKTESMGPVAALSGAARRLETRVATTLVAIERDAVAFVSDVRGALTALTPPLRAPTARCPELPP